MQVNLIASEADETDRSFYLVKLFSKWLAEECIAHRIYKNSEKLPTDDIKTSFNIYVSHDSWYYKNPLLKECTKYSYEEISDSVFKMICNSYDVSFTEIIGELYLGLKGKFSSMKMDIEICMKYIDEQ